jgi:hypothetical protein
MSITSNFPAIKPTLLLDFANTEQLDPRITFTRASTATYYGTQTAKAEENLLLQSQTFDNASWVKTTATVTADSFAAPDGTTTAETLTATSTNSTLLQTFTATATAYTFSVYIYRKTGTGNVDITVDGTTYATQTITGAWARYSITTTPSAGSKTAGIRLATSGDEVYIWGAQLEQRSAATAYTVTTTQAITNYIPQLLTAASGVARFDHNPTTFESLGLEIEESRTNLVTYSAQFDDAAWTKTRASITANTIVAPDGTLTGDKLVEDTTASNSHLVAQSIVFPASGTVTATIYAKAAERNFILFSRTTVNTCGVNLTTGQVVGVSGTDTTATTQSVGNGWWRIILVFPSPNTTATVNIYTSLDGVFANRDYTGNGYSGIYIWGAQLEAGAFATSYIPTVASQVTRAADSASMTGTNFSSWYNQGAGTMYAEAATSAYDIGRTILEASDGTTSNRVAVGRNSSTTSGIGTIITGGATQANIPVSNTFVSGVSGRLAMSFAVNQVNVAGNGILGTTDTSAILPVVDRVRIGAAFNGATIWNGTIRKISFYPIAVTLAQLQALTS